MTLPGQSLRLFQDEPVLCEECRNAWQRERPAVRITKDHFGFCGEHADLIQEAA
jgi:hypothetical protein